MNPAHVIDAIAVDTSAFAGLAGWLPTHSQQGLLSIGLAPMLALYVIESDRALRVVAPALATEVGVRAREQLSRQRRRAKMLDDRYSPVEQVAAELATVAKRQSDYFMAPHAGLLGALVRTTRPDLGMSLCDGHVFSTTDYSAAIVGWAEGETAEQVGRRLKSLYTEVGAYIGALSQTLGVDAVLTSDTNLGTLEMRDIRSDALYRRGALGSLPIDLSVGAAALLVSINNAARIFGPLLPADGLTQLKVKLVTAYHADSGMRYMRARVAQGVGDRRLATLLSPGHPTDGRWLRKRVRLRNMLVHYLPSAAGPVDLGTPSASIEALGSASIPEMTAILDRQLLAMAAALEQGFDLGEKPFPHGVVT